MSGELLAPPWPLAARDLAPPSSDDRRIRRPSIRLERLLWRRGLSLVAGVDEAGRGAWAGPVVAAAAVLPDDTERLQSLLDATAGDPTAFCGVRDSKQLTPAQRSAAAAVIHDVALAVGIGVVPCQVVDELGIACAGQLAFWRAVQSLGCDPDYLLVDGFPLWSARYPQAAVLQGDQRCLSIAAASIIAKVTRDELMQALDLEVPGYGFARNCGYGTGAHRRALQQLGPSSHHRHSYQPVAEAIAGLTGEVDTASAPDRLAPECESDA